MADEPRRSGRATKGQHTKNADDDLPAATGTPTASAPPSAKGASTSKNAGSSKKNAATAAEAQAEEEEEDDSIIRCVCGATADEDGWPMICCDKCEAWQHNLCMGISENDDELPEKYYCEQCRPSAHRELLQAMKRGERPWEERIKARRREEEEERKRKKKGKGGGRKSAGTPVGGKGTPAPVEEKKRKFKETPQELKKSASPTVPFVSTPSLAQRKSSAQVVVPDAKRRKSTADAAHSRKSSINVPPAATSIDTLPTNRQPAAKAISSKSKPIIDSLAKSGQYRIPDGETAASLATSLALQIENALMAIHGDPATYKQQFLAIHSNFPKNPTLVLQLLNGDLDALEIAEMSSDEMASEEVQRERVKAREEADKQSILITESGPRVRKTHKGEEIMGGDEVIKTVGPEEASWMRPVRRDTQDEIMRDAPGDEGADIDAEDRVELPDDADGRHPPPLSVETKRKASQSYNMDRAWNAAHSPDQASYPRFNAPSARPRATGGDAQMHDADIDRLLKDEDSADELPLSPTDAPALWKGRLDMAGVAGFNCSLRWTGGADIGAKIPYASLLPVAKLDITGRIAVQRADEYVAGMRFSNTNDVCVLDVSPGRTMGEDGDVANFGRVWRYFSEKGRWGVLDPKGLGEGVRDAYLVTLEKGGSSYPDFLAQLHEKSIPEPRERDMLLLTLVVKTKSPQQTPVPPAQSPMVGNGKPEYPWATPLVRGILGEQFVHAPAVVQLFTAVPEMSEHQVRNLRRALDEEPRAREDLGVLGEVLRRGAV